MKPFLIILSMISMSLVFTTCARENVFNEPPDHPVIDSIKPASGKKGVQLRLYGSGFSTTSSANTVSINGLVIRVDSPSTSTTLLVTVTDTTGTGPVHIKVRGRESDGPIFTYLRTQDAPVITKADYGWNDGSGYSVNVKNLPVQNAAIRLLVNGQLLSINEIVRPGHRLYKPAEGEQLLISSDTAVENYVPINLADFVVTGNGLTSNTYRLVVRPRIDELEPLETTTGNVMTITGRFFGTRSFPSKVTMYWQNALSPDPAIASWTNTAIKVTIPGYANVPPDVGGPSGYTRVAIDVTVADKQSYPVNFYYKYQ